MNKKELVDHMNALKTVRIELKSELDFINYSIVVFPNSKFLNKKLIGIRNIKNMEYKTYGDCIDAIMDMIDYQQLKQSTTKQLSRINSAVGTFIMPIELIEYINEINAKYDLELKYSLYEYLIVYLNRIKMQLLASKPTEEDVNNYCKYATNKLLELQYKK